MTTGNNDDFVGSISGLSPQSTLALLDPEYRTLNTSITIILKIYPVLILILGSFGNLLSFCVLLRAAMRRYSTFCYLACLALVDIAVLLTFCVNFIALYHFNYDIQNVSFLCKLFAFCIYFLPQYSSWILVAVSIDRVISAKYLRLAKTWSKPRHSVLVTFILGIFFAILNSHFFLYENDSIKRQNSSHTSRQRDQHSMIHNDSVIERYLLSNAFAPQHSHYSLMTGFSDAQTSGNSFPHRMDSSISYEPFTPPSSQLVSRETTIQGQLDNIIGINQQSLPFFDVNTIQCSLENSDEYKHLYVYWAWIDLAMNVFIPFTGENNDKKRLSFNCFHLAMIACTIIIILTLVRSSSRAGSTSARRSRRRRNISVMLITINLVFISLTAPIVIFLSVNEYFKENNNRFRQTILVLIKIICIVLMNLNHAVNIIVYSITAKEFRSEMVNFLHASLYCLIGKPTNPNDLDYIHHDGTFLSRFQHFRRNLFKCCRIKLRSNSTNTTDSSGAHHRTVATPMNHTRSSHNTNHNHKGPKRKRQNGNGNGKRKSSYPRTSETSTHGYNQRLTVQVQADGGSSTYEREDVSFNRLSISTED